MTHLTRAELVAWRDTPSGAARARVVEHLAMCDACAAEYAELIRTRPVEADGSAAAPHFRAEDFVARGYAALPKAPARVIAFPRRLALPLAAAAALVLLVWLPSWRTAPEPVVPTGATRGSSLQPIAPSGDLQGPIEFRWTSPIAPSRYAIEVKNAAGERVFYRETQAERMAADAALDAALLPGVRYTWTVAALDAAGEVITQSAPAAFVRAGARR